MRMKWISMVLAATAMTPAAAWAQDDDGGQAERIRQRIEQRQQARSEARAERGEARQVRSEPQGDAQRSDVAVQRSRGAQGEARHAERSGGAWDDEQRSAREQEQQQEVRAINRRGERNLARQRAWQGGEVNSGEQQNARQQQQEERAINRRGERNLARQRARQGGEVSSGEQQRTWQRDGDGRRDWRNNDGDGHRNWRNNDSDGRRAWRNGENRNWSREWNRTAWRNDRRYDWQSWRYRNRSLFRLPAYYSPYRNYGYSRFSIGLFMQPLFFGQRYWVNDPFHYRLPPAPPGTQWVRYYNDVILVDAWTGEVVDVIYDFFW